VRILVTGARNWADKTKVLYALRSEQRTAQVPGAQITVVHGACPTGADAIADEVARVLGMNVERHPADWDTHGKAAGPLRNQAMVDLGADVCLAFPMSDSRGTVHCMRAARAADIPVRVVGAFDRLTM